MAKEGKNENPSLDMGTEQAAQQPNPAPAVSPEEFRKLQSAFAEQQRMVALLANQNAELHRAMAGNILPEDERPMYETVQPFMSPDDIYYPEGVQFVDVTGEIIPNEFMIPLNEPARRRLEAYLADLPAPGRQPTIAEMIDATSRALSHLGENASRDVIQQAVFASLTNSRVGGHTPGRPINAIPSVHTRASDVPLMANTQIVRGAANVRPTAPGATRPARTQQVGVAPAATADVIGGVSSRPLAHQPV